METLQNLLDSTSIPFISAFILGLMTAISPCPLATNISAMAYLSKSVADKREIFIKSLLYVLGRTLTYSAIGIILFLGASKFSLSRLLQSNGEKFIGPILIIFGLLMLDIIKLNFNSSGSGKLNSYFTKIYEKHSFIASLFMGIVFAMAFCPYSGVIYFGMLIPMSITSVKGLFLPVVFSVATALPVIFFAVIISRAVGSLGKYYNKLNIFEVWLKKIVATIFILVGIYYSYIRYLGA